MFNFFNKQKRPVEPVQAASEVGWDELLPIVEPYKRQAWFPKVVNKTSSPIASKFSGIPALAEGENWPCCGHCGEPMQLFLQLNGDDLPQSEAGVFGGGLLQVFYCTNWEKECEVQCEAYFPFAKSTLVRVVDYSLDNIAAWEQSPVKNAFPEKAIKAWEVKDDYPNLEELENLGVTLSEAQTDVLYDMDYPQPNDKLLGWPHWVQGIEYPNCPECGKTMKLIFQIDSEDNLPYMFGDMGCAHVTQCGDHRDQLAVAWACG